MSNIVTDVTKTDGYYIANKYYNDPVGFFKDVIGFEPDAWQIEAAENIRDFQRLAVASGHGIGKTAAVACIILWFISTRPNPQIVVTANTKNQLDTKTWRELSKWHKKALNKDWFKWTATRFFLIDSPETWFASSIPWSEHNSEAFAGTHEENVLIVFDEASAISDIIWDVTEGAMTTDGARWIAFGNPTKNTGKFRECFGAMKHRWKTMQVDSRTAKMANKEQIQQWLEDYGEDSDFFRIRVKGEFPRAGSSQFISSEAVELAASRIIDAREYHREPLRIGVDVARFGDDQTVLTLRRGRKVFEQIRYRGLDTMEVAAKVYEIYMKHRSNNYETFIFVDGIGVGAGVVDKLKELKVPNIVDVVSGATATDSRQYANKRAELWGRMRDWLENSKPQIPNDSELKQDIISPEYGFNGKMQIQLEKKADMKSRGMASPDSGDSLAMTFEDVWITSLPGQRRNVVTPNSKGWT